MPSPFHHLQDALGALCGEGVVHGEAEDGIRQGAGHGDLGGLGGGGVAVGGEGGDDGVEVAACKDAALLEEGEEFVARAAVLGGINEDGEIGVVVAHAGDVLQAADAVPPSMPRNF